MDTEAEFRKACELAIRGNHEAALDAYEALSSTGHIPSQLRLADSYIRGLGTQADLAAAIKWLEAGRDAGSEDAAELLRLAQTFERIEELQCQWRITGG